MPDQLDQEIIRRLCGELGMDRYPYRALAAAVGIPEAELLARVRDYQAQGLLRRMGAILRHQLAGFPANGMSVWQVPEADVPHVGALLAVCPEISHCYARSPLADWPYNLYAMIHGHCEEECRQIAARLSEATGIVDYQLLFSLREFKKTSRVYGDRHSFCCR